MTIVADDPGVLVRNRVVLWVAVPSAVLHRTEVLVDKFTVCWDAVLAEPASTVAENVTVAQSFYKAVAVVDRVVRRHGAPLAVDVGHAGHLQVLEFEIAVACPVRIAVALREFDIQSGEVYFESEVVDSLHVLFRNARQALLGKEAEAAENVIRFESAGDDVHLVLYLGFHNINLAKMKATRRQTNNNEKIHRVAMTTVVQNYSKVLMMRQGALNYLALSASNTRQSAPSYTGLRTHQP